MIVPTTKGEQGMSGDLDLTDSDWRTSSHSSQGADCVEVSVLDIAGEQ